MQSSSASTGENIPGSVRVSGAAKRYVVSVDDTRGDDDPGIPQAKPSPQKEASVAVCSPAASRKDCDSIGELEAPALSLGASSHIRASQLGWSPSLPSRFARDRVAAPWSPEPITGPSHHGGERPRPARQPTAAVNRRRQGIPRQQRGSDRVRLLLRWAIRVRGFASRRSPSWRWDVPLESVADLDLDRVPDPSGVSGCSSQLTRSWRCSSAVTRCGCTASLGSSR